MCDRRTGVFRVRGAVPDGTYESALVLPVPGAIADLIDSLRRVLPYPAPPEYQLDPHLTVLYLGRVSAVGLGRLSAGLAALNDASLDVRFAGFGIFESEAFVTNLHLRVEHDHRIEALHQAAVEICVRDLGWTPGTTYYGPHYVPHVSILDRIRVLWAGFTMPDAALAPREPVRLSDLHQIAKRIGPAA